MKKQYILSKLLFNQSNAESFPSLGIDVIVYTKYLMCRFIFVCLSLVGPKWHPRKGDKNLKIPDS